MNKPTWWSGSWDVKCVLIWFGGFLVWLPVVSIWPDSTAATVALALFLLSMLPLVFWYALRRLAGPLWLLCLLGTLVRDAVRGSLRKLRKSRDIRVIPVKW